MSSKLKMDWCSFQAAKHAVENWHYSQSMPVGKMIRIGAWEDERFIGVIIFSRGACKTLGNLYGYGQTECVELTRIAMREHRTPITRMVRIALIMLKKKCPGLRLIVSFADPDQGHQGGIYKGGNWIPSGRSTPADEYVAKGQRIHGRSARAMRAASKRDTKLETLQWLQKHYDPNAVRVYGSSKIRFLMPLDRETKDKICAESIESDATTPPGGKGRGSTDLGAPKAASNG